MAYATPPLPGFEPGARRSKRRKRIRTEQDRQRDRDRDRLRKRAPRTCLACGKQYHPTCGDQIACSRQCAFELHPRKPKSCRVYFPDCAWCGKTFSSRIKRQVTCSQECRYRRMVKQISARIVERYRTEPEFRDRMVAAAQSRRADKLGLDSEAILLSYLIERDRRRCGICHRPVRAKRGPMRPSIDHIIPLKPKVGPKGTHDLVNVQLAHYRCNLSKNNRGGGEQLLLIG